MEAEPPKVDPPKRKRRWFQFSLRSLLIGVTLLAVFSGWQAHVAASRKAVAATYRTRGASLMSIPKYDDRPVGVLLWLRIRFIGDIRIDKIHLPKDSFAEKDAAELRDVFPEAEVNLGFGRWVD
jgi:hypothetical protein